MTISSELLDFIKGEEGFTPIAVWDFRQWTNGYGTRAHSPKEPITHAVAEQRLDVEVAAAQASVDGFKAGLVDGLRRALTDLTFNAGPGWMHAGLGQAVLGGDLEEVKVHLLQYDEAGGRVNKGLLARRTAEASWFA